MKAAVGRRVWILFAVALAILGFVLGFVTAALAYTPVALSGTVENASSSAALAGASVEVINQTGHAVLYAGSTTSAGVFATTVGAGWATWITVNATGFKNYQSQYLATATNSSLILKVRPNTAVISLGFSGPSSVSVLVDGTATALPATETWAVGSSHNITAPEYAQAAAGSRWVFSSWTPKEARSFVLPVAGSESFVLAYYAQFQVTVTYNSAQGSVSPGSGWFNATSSPSFTATPLANYRFARWTLDSQFNSTSNPIILSSLSAPHVLGAVFSLGSVSVAFTLSGGPTSMPATVDGVAVTLPASYSWLPGSSHTVSAAAYANITSASRYVFLGWSGASSATTAAITILAPASAATYTAGYQTENRLAISYNTGEGSVSPSSGFYPSAASESLTATADSNYRFVNWVVDGSYNSSAMPLPVAMSSPHTVAAYFLPLTETYGFAVTGAASIPAVVDGKQATFPATYEWSVGSTHTVSYSGAVFTGSYNNSRLHLTGVTLDGSQATPQNLTISVGPSSHSYSFSYAQQYYLSVRASDSRVAAQGSGWFAKGAVESLSAPSSLSLTSGGTLVLQGCSVNGIFTANETTVSVTVNAPEQVKWVYALDFKLTLNAQGNDLSDLGTGAVFTVGSATVPNHGSIVLPSAQYQVKLTYAGQMVNSTKISLTADYSYTATVLISGKAGPFTFTVFGGILVSDTLVGNSSLSISASGTSGRVQVFIPPNYFPTDFFIVSGVANSSFDQLDRRLVVPFQGSASFTVSQPQGTTYSLGTAQVVEAMVAGQTVSEFSAFEVDPTHIGVNFQTLTQQLGVELAVPFKPIYDPQHLYSLTFGYYENGAVLVAAKTAGEQITFKEALQSLEYGQLEESSALSAPTTNAITVPMERATSATNTGCVGSTYEVDVLGQPFAAACWTIGTGNLVDVWVYNLQNQYVASATVTAMNRTLLAITGGSGTGSTQTVGIAFQDTRFDASDAIFTGTAPVAVKTLPAGKFGPQTVSFDGNPQSPSMSCLGAGCGELGYALGGFDPITMKWKAMPQGSGFNVTINGVPLIVDGDPSCSAARNLTASQQPGVDLSKCVQGSPSQGASGDGYVTFTPSQAKQFLVCVSQQSFAGNYQGCDTVYAYANNFMSTVYGAVVIVAAIALIVWGVRHQRPPPSFRAEGRE